MESIKDINKALKIDALNLEGVNKCLKCYGTILKDISTPKNRRYTIIKYKNYYFKIVMFNGDVIEVEKSIYEIQI